MEELSSCTYRRLHICQYRKAHSRAWIFLGQIILFFFWLVEGGTKSPPATDVMPFRVKCQYCPSAQASATDDLLLFLFQPNIAREGRLIHLILSVDSQHPSFFRKAGISFILLAVYLAVHSFPSTYPPLPDLHATVDQRLLDPRLLHRPLSAHSFLDYHDYRTQDLHLREL